MQTKDLVKKSALIGLGALSITKEKIEKLVKHMEKQGHVSEKEGRILVKQLLRQSKKHVSKMQKVIEKEVDRALKAADR